MLSPLTPDPIAEKELKQRSLMFFYSLSSSDAHNIRRHKLTLRAISIKEALHKTGLGKTSLYKLIGEQKFPKPINLGERRVAWIESEIDEWIRARITERDLQIGNISQSN